MSKNVDRVMVTAKLEAELRAESFLVEIAQRCEQHRWHLAKKHLQVEERRRGWKHASSLPIGQYMQSLEPFRAVPEADVSEIFVRFDILLVPQCSQKPMLRVVIGEAAADYFGRLLEMSFV